MHKYNNLVNHVEYFTLFKFVIINFIRFVFYINKQICIVHTFLDISHDLKLK